MGMQMSCIDQMRSKVSPHKYRKAFPGRSGDTWQGGERETGVHWGVLRFLFPTYLLFLFVSFLFFCDIFIFPSSFFFIVVFSLFSSVLLLFFASFSCIFSPSLPFLSIILVFYLSLHLLLHSPSTCLLPLFAYTPFFSFFLSPHLPLF